MNTAIFCFSDRGAKLAVRLSGLLGLPLSCVHSTFKFADKYGFTGHESVRDDMGGLFGASRLLIFVSACGIAVRSIAPHLKSKATDPAVLVIDDAGRFVISLLSGHLGGANGNAAKIAALIGAVPVVTTATDSMGRFSCDSWAAGHNCALSDLDAAKAVSASILEGDVAVSSEYPLPETLPAGLVRAETGKIGIFIGVRKAEPYVLTLRLVPRVLCLGIGCRRGVSAGDMETAVRRVLDGAGIDMRAVAKIATIDIKRDEAGLLAFADSLRVPLRFYSAQELAAAEGTFEESDFVRKTVGVGNVCQRAAALEGRVILPKTALNGVTVAVSTADWRPDF